MPQPSHELLLEGVAKTGLVGLIALGLVAAIAFLVPSAMPEVAAWVRGGPSSAPSTLPSAGVVVLPATQPASRPVRTLVIIIPGTHGSEKQWPMVLPGKATFGSELRRAAGPETDIVPLVWFSSLSHQERKEAKDNLVDLINQKSAQYNRICLIGHSHGGNIALWAAGECKPRVEMVICLSTPFVCLQTRDGDGKMIDLPVYCTTRSRQNIDKIVSIVPDTDGVPDGWADIDIGLSQNEAIRLTYGWQEKFNHPRLKDDGWMSGSNLTACRDMNFADLSVTMQSAVTGGMGTVPHGAVHSRRMGSVIGQLIAGGVSEQEANYLRTLLQPANADAGWPIPQAEQDQIISLTATAQRFIGWRLDSIDAQLSPPKAGKSLYFFARLTAATPDGVSWAAPYVHGTQANWKTNYVLPASSKSRFELIDDGYLWNSTLGTVELDGTREPPPTVSGTHGSWKWSARLHWSPVHY